MKKIYYLIIIALISMSLSSCESFLDQVPLHSLTQENAITDFNKAQASVAGIYSTFQNDYYSGGLYCLQAAKAGFFRPTSQDYLLSYTQTSGGNPNGWSGFYKSLNAANSAIGGITAMPESAVPSEAERSALIAEARCLRAWINLNILWNFGHWWADDSDVYGLLYRDQMVDMTNVLQPRLTIGESYDKIYEDLDYAIQNMKSFTSPRYVSKQFAEALKAKALLYRGAILNNTSDLQSALELVNSVMSSLPPSCSMEPDMADAYDKAWDSKENLFVKYLEDDATRTSKAGYYYPYGICYVGYSTNLPLAPGGEATAGLNYGYNWFSSDPRWNIITGDRRRAETWDSGRIWTWSKLYRLGSYLGKVNDPVDEKYATYWFRYPELYLMKAELLARTGATVSQAIAPINEMRSKRTNPVLPALNPADQDELMDLIFKEICLETIMENGSEFFASLRFRKDGQPRIVAIKGGMQLEWNRVCWPIPDAEMINNPEMVQNPDLN